MLEGLDSIDWAHIRHSHGTAEEFPLWIRSLTSDDGAVCEEALDKVWEYANHQGSIYQVTPYVVPFVIELLQCPSVQNKENLLYLLFSFTRSARPTDESGLLRDPHDEEVGQWEVKPIAHFNTEFRYIPAFWPMLIQRSGLRRSCR